MIKRFFKKIKSSFKNFKDDCTLSFKLTFHISWELRKKIIFKRLLMLPFIIILTYLIVSYLDFVLLKMSYVIYFGDYWMTIPDWIDFPIDETPYEVWANQYSVTIVCAGGAYIIFYCITIFFYEVQMFANKYLMFFLLTAYFWLDTNDPDILLFHLICYMGSILCWANYFLNWCFYWGWNFYQWAIDLEEEIEEGEEWEERAHQLAKEGNISTDSWVNYFWKKSTYEHLLKPKIKDNSKAQRIYIGSVYTAWWNVLRHFHFEIMRSYDIHSKLAPSEIADKIYGTSPVQVEDRYRKHLFKYHLDALFFEELRDRMDDMYFKEIKHKHREDFIDADDLYIHEDDFRTREYEDMEKWRLFNLYSYYGPVSDIIYYHLTEFRPWFTRPNVIGKYSLFTRRYVKVIYNKIMYEYYVIYNGCFLNFTNIPGIEWLGRFCIRFINSFPFSTIKKIYNSHINYLIYNWVNNKIMAWFYFKRKWKIRRTVKRLNLKADRKKKIEDPFFYKTKEINFKN